MAIFDDPMFQVTAHHSPSPASRREDEVARGDSWSVRKRGDGYALDYLSGEHVGREKSVEITEAEAQGLAAREITVDAVPIAHGVS